VESRPVYYEPAPVYYAAPRYYSRPTVVIESRGYYGRGGYDRGGWDRHDRGGDHNRGHGGHGR
jgi:hypothetical protein